MNSEMPILTSRELTKTFSEVNKPLLVLDGVDFAIYKNQTIAILGASGSGKSTLLHLLGGLDAPSSGKVLWGAQDINGITEAKKCRLRNKHLGFIYQFHHLLPEFTALENTAMPLLIGGEKPREASDIAKNFLHKVGLSSRADHKIGELSGGERQRVAIARALVTKPACVLADEPTGNLDQHTAEKVLQVMLDLQKELSTSFVVVTHDSCLADAMQISYTLKDAKLNKN